MLVKDDNERMRKMTFREILARDGKLVYKNRGDSMLPLIREGRDLVLIERFQSPPRKYDIPLYQRDTGEYVLHRILRIRKDGYVLCGDNQWKRETGIQARHLVGVMTAVIRDGRQVPLNGWPYRLYVHAWCDFFPVRAGIIRVRNRFRRCLRAKRENRKGRSR